MTTLRLLADDLTGALDTAAELVGLAGSVPVFWHGALSAALPASAALDSGTRELETEAAASITATFAAALSDTDISFKKVDSLMRGPTLAEVATCFRHGAWRYAVMAPAFPYQGRITRGGVQHVRDRHGAWVPVGGDILARLHEAGAPAHKGRLGAEPSQGILLFDAETDADLAGIAAFGRTLAGPVLWIGTGGLAHALADGRSAVATTPLPRPLLGLFGSDQEVTAAQLVACGTDWLELHGGEVDDATVLQDRLEAHGRAVASVRLPTGIERADAAARIASALDRLASRLPPPGTLIVAGGETLRGLCLSLGAECLELQGRIVPGLPRSILRGGRWDGVTVVSKSGAFGAPTLLRDLLCHSLTTERAA